MDLEYAIERLYQAGWHPSLGADSESLPDGRRFPSVKAVQREFSDAGLDLTITHHPQFNCYRATWRPSRPVDDSDAVAGTVVASTDREVAVYALAQLHAAQQPALATANS
ncbi:MAG: hypothetical protein ACREJC_06915 [Tepidisphaeraceae bacterium]